MPLTYPSFNICIIRPPGYIWSSVFQELADLIFYSLEDLGCTVKIHENKIQASAVNVVIGAHLLDHKMILALPKDTVVFNTEQMGAGSRRWNEKIKLLVSRYTSWDYSLQNILEFGHAGLTTPHFFKIGFHPRLQRIKPALEKDIDVLFYGSLTPERKKVLGELKSHGLRVVHLSGVFGDERDAHIARSKMVLNLHQHGTKILEVVRIHYLMNNGVVVVSQYDADSTGAEDYREGLVLAKYDEVVEQCVTLCASDELLQQYANRSLCVIKKLNAVEIMRKMIEI